jgi:hypothetical protein
MARGMQLPSLFEVPPEPRYRKYVKYGTLIAVVALLLLVVLWFLFRFHSEKTTVNEFMDQVVAGHFQSAYKMWHAGASYAYSDFLQDWGPKGYYGPVHSYKITAAHEPKDASGVIILVDVSPFSPFPSDNDFEKARKTQTVRLWVQFADHSISYAP